MEQRHKKTLKVDLRKETEMVDKIEIFYLKI